MSLHVTTCQLGYATLWVTDRGSVFTSDMQPILQRRGGPHRKYAMVYAGGEREYTHRLVLRAFRGPAPAGTEGSHLNDDPDDNRLSNLQWETHQDNCKRRKGGIKPDISGVRNPNAKLSVDRVCAVHSWKGRASACHVGRIFGCSDVTVGNIWKGRQWSSVTGQTCI